MKNIFILLCSVMVLLVTSCKKNNSNYDLKAAESIVVEGLESSYTLISQKDKLIINPKVTSNENEADFDYAWWVYETNAVGIPKADTIGKTKKLEYFVELPANNWVLVYRVTNKKTKYTRFLSAELKIVTEFTRGWYVLKDDGTQSDLDLFLTPTSIVPTELRENVYSFVNGHKLDGKAKIMNVFSGYTSMVTGVIGVNKTFFMTTDKDISAVDVSTLKEARNINTLFIGAPEFKNPGAAFANTTSYSIINDGGFHSLNTSSANDGRFGARVLKNVSNTPCRLSDYYLTSINTDAYVFDEISSSFLSLVNGSGNVFTAITDIAGTAMPAANNNKKILYMGYKSNTYIGNEYRYVISGFAIFQDKTNSALKILSELSPDKTKMKIVNDTLKTTDKLYNGTLHTVLDGDENMMYFVVGNEVWSRNLSNKFERLQYVVPSGETVTFIRHKKYSFEESYSYNYVMIGTQSGSNYKVRMFMKPSGNLVAVPTVTLEGKGTVRDVMYMAPFVGEYSYSQTY